MPDVESLYLYKEELYCYGHARRFLDAGLVLGSVRRSGAACAICASAAVAVPRAWEQLAHRYERGEDAQAVAEAARELLAAYERTGRGSAGLAQDLRALLAYAPDAPRTDPLLAETPAEDVARFFRRQLGRLLDRWDARYLTVQRTILPHVGGPLQDVPAALEAQVTAGNGSRYHVTFVAVSVVERNAVDWKDGLRQDLGDVDHDLVTWLRPDAPELDPAALDHLRSLLPALRAAGDQVRRTQRWHPPSKD